MELLPHLKKVGYIWGCGSALGLCFLCRSVRRGYPPPLPENLPYCYLFNSFQSREALNALLLLAKLVIILSSSSFSCEKS